MKLGAPTWPLPALGAIRPPHTPDEHRWRVLLDPAGRPFCLCRITG